MLTSVKNWPLGKGVLTLVAAMTMGGGYWADWNETHLFNPRWPPHAKFHDAQTLLLGTLLGALSLWFLWGQRGAPRATLRLAVLFGGVYWVTQAGAILLPGPALTDPEFYHPNHPPRQVQLDLLLLGLVLPLAYAWEARRLARRAPPADFFTKQPPRHWPGAASPGGS